MKENFQSFISDQLLEIGYRLIRAKFIDSPTKILEIRIEKKDFSTVTIKECVVVSKHLSRILDVEDAIKGSYNLQVSSGGLDRPLIGYEDFKRFKNYSIYIKTSEPYNGQKKITGTILKVNKEKNVLYLQDDKHSILHIIKLSHIQDAHLDPKKQKDKHAA